LPLHEAALPVPALRPGIGMNQVDALKRRGRQPGEQFSGVAGVEPEVVRRLGLEPRQDLGETVEIGFATDESCIDMRSCFGEQMFAATKTDLEIDVADVGCKQFGE